MNITTEFLLKGLRKVYSKIFYIPSLPKPKCEQNPDKVSEIMYSYLTGPNPCMIARFGSTELNMIVNYLGIKKYDRNLLRFIRSESIQWWWGKNFMNQIRDFSGFFPPTKENIEKFCELMIGETKQIDVLGSWRPEEVYLECFLKSSQKVSREIQNPFFVKQPWTTALKGKIILVVHPFAELIEKQYYENREHLFDNPNILPEFDLITIKAVQSLGGNPPDFNDWFEALDWMKAEIDKVDYDICLIGCGAYGFPLAAHVKRNGKKAVHLGGSLQLLFGIKGKRWENPAYNEKYNYAALMNNYWVKPGDNLKPANATKVEDACYW